MAEIGKNLQANLTKTAANTVSAVGETMSGTTKLADTTVKGSLKAADQITEAGLDATGRIGVASADAAATVGEEGAKVASTAAKSVSGTANTIYKTASRITEVAAAKGDAIAAKSIARDEAKTKALNEPENKEKMQEVAKKEQELEFTKQKYEAEQASLRAEAKNETDLINLQIKAVESKVKKTGELTNAQNNALIKASEAKEAVMKAQDTAARIETEANNEIECRNVLTKAATKPLAGDHNVLNNRLGHNTFCTNKKVCESTGKVHSWYNILGSNTTTCKHIKQKYKTFEGMSSNAVAASGGRKTDRKRIKRKNNTRKPKKNTRRPKKNTRRPKKNTRRPKKKTRRTKRRRTKRRSI